MEQGKRFNKGKLRQSIAPFGALHQVMAVAEFGAEKYGARNYQKGLPISSFLDSAYRHAYLSFQAGEDNDPESGLPHLAHAAWNLLAALEQMQSLPELDDRKPNAPVKSSQTPTAPILITRTKVAYPNDAWLDIFEKTPESGAV